MLKRELRQASSKLHHCYTINDIKHETGKLPIKHGSKFTGIHKTRLSYHKPSKVTVIS